MRDNLERVTIVLTKDQHLRFKEYAKRYHGSVSQFIRLAGDNEILGNSGNDDLKVRPIVEKMEKTGRLIQQIEVQLKKVERGINFVVRKIGTKEDQIAHEIAEILLSSDRSLSIPEITGYLAYKQEDVICGIEKLEERFAVTRIEQINSPSKWKIRGDFDVNC